MEKKANKSAEAFEATVTALDSIWAIWTRWDSGVDKKRRTYLPRWRQDRATDDLTSIRDKLKNCSKSAKAKCQKSSVKACTNQTLHTKCSSELQGWLTQYGPSNGSCLQLKDSEASCICITKLPAISSECLKFSKKSQEVVASKKKCTSGDEEGSFGHCKKLQVLAAEKGPGAVCKNPGPGNTTTVSPVTTESTMTTESPPTIESESHWIAKKLIPPGFPACHYHMHDFDTEKMAKEATHPINCLDSSPFRTINATCNNLVHKTWGSSNIAYRRLLTNSYKDGISIPRGGSKMRTLPSARDISIRFHWQINRQSPIWSNLFYQFGQFVSHDSGLTPEINLETDPEKPAPHGCSDPEFPLGGGFNNTACATDCYKNSSKCFNIDVTGDSFYENRLPTYPHLAFGRTLNKNGTKIREQINAGTGFHDASIVYGFNKKLSDELRTMSGGKFNTTEENNLLPVKPIDGDSCVGLKGATPVAGGDPRVNMHPWLLSLQTLFLREHNRLAEAIGMCSMRCALTDEEIFQNSRRILIAEYQNIIYTEFLPHVIGAKAMEKYNLNPTVNSRYNNSMDPSIFNGFQTAAMRFGHSMVQDGNLKLQNLTDGRALPEGLRFLNNFFNDAHYYKDSGKGNDEVLGGMTIQGCQRVDRHVSRDLTHWLYDVKGKKPFGDDLASRNIQRGRDHGLPPYMEYRKLFGLSTSTSSKDKISDISEPYWELLMDIYKGKPEDIDLWTGGLAEEMVEGGSVGPLFQHIIGKQFHNSKSGDRFFFTHEDQTGSFTIAQQEILKKRTMRDLICENTNIPSVRLHALEIREDEDLITCKKEGLLNQINMLGDVCDFIKCSE